MRKSYLLLGAVTTGWGTIPVLAGLVHVPSALIVAIRLWTAAIALGVVLLLTSRRERRLGVVPPPRLLSVDPVRCVLVSAVLACHWLALFAAYKRAPAGTVILIVYLAPIGVAALAPRMLGERLGRRTLLALAGATAGFALVAAPTVRAAGASGLLLSLIAALLFVFLILLSKPLSSVYGGLRLAFMEMAGAGLILVPVALGTAWPSPSPSWLWLLVLGLFHTAFGIAVYLSVLSELPATHVGILGYLEPVGVVVCAWLFLGQRPAVATVLGGALVIGAGVAMVVWGEAWPGEVADVPLSPGGVAGRGGVPGGMAVGRMGAGGAIPGVGGPGAAREPGGAVGPGAAREPGGVIPRLGGPGLPSHG